MLQPTAPHGPAVDRKMIFVTGASRSGTTLLSHVLGNHSLVCSLPELHYFGDLWDPKDTAPLFDERRCRATVAALIARLEHGIFRARVNGDVLHRAEALLAGSAEIDHTPPGIFAMLAERFAEDRGKSIPCEQTPRNIFYAQALLRMYPRARIVHIVRDPRAVMASQKKRWQRRRLATDRTALPVYAALRTWVNYHPYTMANLWLRASREARRMAAHPRVTTIRFEDLLRDPESTVRALCASLRLDYEPRMLEISQINSSHQSSVGGARKGFHPEAADSWKDTLSPQEQAIAERICGELMTHYGYGEISPPPRPAETRYALTYLFHLAAVLAVNPKRAWIQFRAASRVNGMKSAI